MTTILQMSEYLLRVLPGLVLVAVVMYGMRPTAAARVALYLLAFVLLRDALTPLGLWRFGVHSGVFWIRLSDDPWFLVLFGLSAAAMATAVYAADKENRHGVVLLRGEVLKGVVAGLLGFALVVLPLVLLYRLVPLAQRGGEVEAGLLPAILVFALLGNFLEELLFRGYVLAGLTRHAARAAGRTRLGSIMTPGVQSGFVFALCHVFLATTVSSAGAPLLLFTLWEGVIAGIVGERYGVLPATITHGGAIFLLSSGLV